MTEARFALDPKRLRREPHGRTPDSAGRSTASIEGLGAITPG